MYIARNKDGTLFLYGMKPSRKIESFIKDVDDPFNPMPLPMDSNPEVSWLSSPFKLKCVWHDEELEDEKPLRVLVARAWVEGNVAFRTSNGIHTIPFKEFVKQPLDDILYDINRDQVTILTCLDDPKWINDYALTRLLHYYYDKLKAIETSTAEQQQSQE